MSSAYHKRSPAGSFSELWRVALPLVLSSGSVSLMHFVDRVFLTWYSTDALAASMPAGVLHWTVLSVLFGTVMYVNTFVAQYDGAQRPDRLIAAVWQGIYLAFAGGFAFLLLAPCSTMILGWVGHEPRIQQLEVDYFSILCMGTVPVTVSMAQSCFYSGRGLTRVVMVVNFCMAAVNISLDYLLIFGKAGFPEMGIRGAAVATVVAYSAAMLIYTGLSIRRSERCDFGYWKRRGFDRELFARLLRYGLPTGFQHFAEIAGFSVFVFLVGLIGTRELAATSLAFNLNSLAFIPMMGIGTAVMTLVGRRVGEGRPELAVRTTWLAFALAGSYMLVFVAIYLFLPELILYPYAANTPPAEFETLSRQVIGLLRFVALYSFFDGMAIVFSSAIRGAGDTRFAMIFTVLSAWIVMVLPTYIAWEFYGGSLHASWWACTAYIIVIGFGFLIRFLTGQWKTMRIIDDVPAPDSAPAKQPAGDQYVHISRPEESPLRAAETGEG